MDRVAFTLFGIPVMWYGILISLGVVGGVLVARRECRRIGIKEDDILDLCLWMIPTAIIGARAYYVIFEWQYYSQHLDEILNIRNGGLSLHGAVLAGILVGFIFCKVKILHFFLISYVCSP